MKTLIVVAHPDEDSLTCTVAARLRDRIGRGAELADLAREGFEPVFGTDDRQAYRGEAPPPAAVLAEQQRLDGVEHLVLVTPVWWWSLPALLKGWVDRVFLGGWAFEEDAEGGVVGRLGGLTLHLLLVAGATERVYDRHRYAEAIETQVVHGVGDFCGMPRGAVAWLHDVEATDGEALEAAVEAAVAQVADAVG